jgi:hypothetical protein
MKRSTDILSVGLGGILPAAQAVLTRRDARLPHRQDACATARLRLVLDLAEWT